MQSGKLYWYIDRQGKMSGPVDVATLSRLLASGDITLNTKLVQSDGRSTRVRDLPEFGGNIANWVSKGPTEAAYLILFASTLLLASLLWSRGPTGVMILMFSPKPYDETVVRPIPFSSDHELSEAERRQLRHILSSNEQSKADVRLRSYMGLGAYLASLLCTVYALMRGGTRQRDVRIVAIIIFVAAFLLLCYSIIHRHDSLSRGRARFGWWDTHGAAVAQTMNQASRARVSWLLSDGRGHLGRTLAPYHTPLGSSGVGRGAAFVGTGRK
ncbi:MAG: DUF4339 domain-containing protein [Fimbriimonadales bacterium]|nr:MAG: hypothetical protein KatS3mg018_0861 [Fimbriimonadales bacterium]